MGVSEFMQNFSDMSSGDAGLILKLLFFTSVIVVYSVFIFYFYKFLAKKNIININLNKYNNSDNPSTTKFFAVLFYIIEYIIILPVITFFWFSVLSILVLVLAKNIPITIVLLISGSLVASVRITAYVSEQLSQDLAKLIPFILLGIAITDPLFFTLAPLLERIIEIPSLLTKIPYYLVFIVSVELFMRFLTIVEGAIKGNFDE